MERIALSRRTSLVLKVKLCFISIRFSFVSSKNSCLSHRIIDNIPRILKGKITRLKTVLLAPRDRRPSKQSFLWFYFNIRGKVIVLMWTNLVLVPSVPEWGIFLYSSKFLDSKKIQSKQAAISTTISKTVILIVFFLLPVKTADIRRLILLTPSFTNICSY